MPSKPSRSTFRPASSAPQALALENAELRARLECQQKQLDHAAAQRERDAAEKSALRMQVAALDGAWRRYSPLLTAAKDARERAESLSSALMFQVSRREQAEMAALAAESSVHGMEQEMTRLKRMLGELGRELSAVEEQLRCSMKAEDPAPLSRLIRGRKVLYVGGRPSSTPSIRALVERDGGEYRRHEGDIEGRRSRLAQALTWADLVVAPLDCFDHDSAIALERECVKRGLTYVPLRTASIASFAAGLGAMADASHRPPQANRICLRHG